MRDLSSSKAGSSYQTITSRDADNSFEKNDSRTNLRICWPGANLPGNNSSCSTPQSSRGNAVQDATPSHTPYADSHFSRSTFKVTIPQSSSISVLLAAISCINKTYFLQIKSDRDSYDLFSTGRKRRLTSLDGAKVLSCVSLRISYFRYYTLHA